MNKDYMKNTFDNVMNKVKTMIVDGAMATELETMGCDLNDELWSAKVLAEQPELIKKVHLSYLRPEQTVALQQAIRQQYPDI